MALYVPHSAPTTTTTYGYMTDIARAWPTTKATTAKHACMDAVCTFLTFDCMQFTTSTISWCYVCLSKHESWISLLLCLPSICQSNVQCTCSWYCCTIVYWYWYCTVCINNANYTINTNTDSPGTISQCSTHRQEQRGESKTNGRVRLYIHTLVRIAFTLSRPNNKQYTDIIMHRPNYVIPGKL